MSESINFSKVFPSAPARIFFLGIGGIGMSGLAQFLVARGYTVGGSDRGLEDESKRDLYDSLRQQGMELFMQDGSGPVAFKPDAFVASAAIEPGNPDMVAMPDVPVIHRATALAAEMAKLGCPRISVAGSCGKTSVTGWIAASLKHLGYRIAMINGGYTLDFESQNYPGNFYMDAAPQIVVAEVDESDRSIREFSQEYSVLLNVGNDHYEKSELEQVFGDFLKRTSNARIVLDSLKSVVPQDGKGTIQTFCAPEGYQAEPTGISFRDEKGKKIHARQSGRHSALNGMAVLKTLEAVCAGKSLAECAASLDAFHGVRQRFEIMALANEKSNFPVVVNDYAHNPEKLQAALYTASERFGGPILAFFQPHGFGPLKFMRQPLVEMLKETLHKNDLFCFLPVFYAGGTTGFSPTSQEVAEDAKKAGLSVAAVENREEAEAIIRKRQSGIACILVLGARDASLRTWAKELSTGKR